MDETKDKKEAETGRRSSSPSSLPMTVMKPERRRMENALIRHWMELGKKALDRPDGIVQVPKEQAEEDPGDEITPAA